MARSITIRSIDRRGDRTFFRIEDQAGHASEIEVPVNTLAELRAWVRERLSETDELLFALALAVYFTRDPNNTNPAQILNRTITLDLAGRINYPDALFRVG